MISAISRPSLNEWPIMTVIRLGCVLDHFLFVLQPFALRPVKTADVVCREIYASARRNSEARNAITVSSHIIRGQPVIQLVPSNSFCFSNSRRKLQSRPHELQRRLQLLGTLRHVFVFAELRSARNFRFDACPHLHLPVRHGCIYSATHSAVHIR